MNQNIHSVFRNVEIVYDYIIKSTNAWNFKLDFENVNIQNKDKNFKLQGCTKNKTKCCKKKNKNRS